MVNRTVAQYAELLSEEREACLSLDFAALERLTEKKKILNEVISKLPPEIWKDLIDQIEKNQDLLSALMSGIKNARDHLNGIPPTVFTTYSETGEVKSRQISRTFERKA